MGIVSGELRIFGDAFMRGPVAARSGFDGSGFSQAPPATRIGILNTVDARRDLGREGAAIPVGRQDLDYESLLLRKLALIVVTTAEAARSPEATSTIERC